MLKVPVCVPVTVGVKASVNVQLELAGTLPPWPCTKLHVLLWMLKTFIVPVKVALVIVIAVVPAFWKVTTPVPVLPTFVVQVSFVGETFTAVPSPLINRPCFTRQMLA